jgi:hypothetical protein
MSYQAIHYTMVFEAFRTHWGDAWYSSVNPDQWNIWRRQIKALFDEGILIKEIIAAIPEASEPRKWRFHALLVF